MFEQLKSFFSHANEEPIFPDSVWALTILLNPDTTHRLTPTEAVDFAIRNKDDIAERTLPLWFGGDEQAKTVDLFTVEADACDYVGILSDWRTVDPEEAGRATFGLVLLRREILHRLFANIQNLKITLDIGLPDERVITMDELRRYAKAER